MDDLRERVAKAIYRNVVLTRAGKKIALIPWDQLSEQQRSLSLAGADAAIEEATPAIRTAGFNEARKQAALLIGDLFRSYPQGYRLAPEAWGKRMAEALEKMEPEG